MRTIPTLGVVIALAIGIFGCTQPPTGVAAAAEAMGAMDLNSIHYSGSGSQFAFGQAPSPGERWPRFEAKTYAVAVDYQTPALRLEMVRAQGEHPPHGGGGQPFAGDQRSTNSTSGDSRALRALPAIRAATAPGATRVFVFGLSSLQRAPADR